MAVSFRRYFWLLLLAAGLAGAGCFGSSARRQPELPLAMASEKVGPPRGAMPDAGRPTPTSVALGPPAGGPTTLPFGDIRLTAPDRRASLTLERPGADSAVVQQVGASDSRAVPDRDVTPPPPALTERSQSSPATREGANTDPPPPVPAPPDRALPPPPPGSSEAAELPAAPARATAPTQDNDGSVAVLPALTPAAAPKSQDPPPRLEPVATKVAQAGLSLTVPGNGPAGSLRALHRRAADRYAGVEAYLVKLTRRERVGGQDRPEEVILLKFRKSPWSIYLKWIGGDGAGRELVYVRGWHGNQVHTRLTPREAALNSGSRRISLPLESPQLLARSRHPVTELGLGALIDQFGTLVDAVERGDQRGGSVRYLGRLQRPEFDGPVEVALHVIPPGVERGLPRGGQRLWFFDSNLSFPILVITRDYQGREVEYYRYEELLFPAARWGDDHFNPDVLWGR
jgi:hypothetical protein